MSFGGVVMWRLTVSMVLLCYPLILMSTAHRLAAEWGSSVMSTDDNCRFPSAWHGTWYESEIGQLTITPTNISRKGHCIQRVDNYYMLENLDIGCFTCLLISSRHANVLQYKEMQFSTHFTLLKAIVLTRLPPVTSFCIGKEPIEIVCSTIHVETVSRTMIRESGETVPCPLYDAYHVGYNNNSGGFCMHPPSYLSPCAGESHLHFHLEKCAYVAYTYRRDVELECLATWRDGTDHYVVGRFHGPGFSRKDDRYRCLMYQVLGTVVHAAMSADSSCRGLRSPRDGPLLFELTKDIIDWPQSRCSFPSWLSRTDWRDLDDRATFTIGASNGGVADIIRVSQRPDVTSSSSPTVVKSYRCLRPNREVELSTEFYVAMMFISDVCKTAYQCAMFVKRSQDVIEMYTGALLEDGNQLCLESELKETGERKLLIPNRLSASHCPLEGRYNIRTGSTSCDSYFRSGCNGTSVIDIISTCSSRPGMQLECLTTWQESDKRMLIAQLLGGNRAASCFSFRERSGQTLHFSAEPECNAGVTFSGPLKDRTVYVMANSGHECEYTTRTTKVVVASSSHVDRDSSPVNGSSDNLPSYSILDPLAGTSSAGVSGGRQLRQHKTTRTGSSRLQHDSALTSLSTSRLTPFDQTLSSLCLLTALTRFLVQRTFGELLLSNDR